MIRKVALWSLVAAVPLSAYAASSPGDIPPLDGIGAVVRDVAFFRDADPVPAAPVAPSYARPLKAPVVKVATLCPETRADHKAKELRLELTRLTEGATAYAPSFDRAEAAAIKDQIRTSLDKIVAPSLDTLAEIELETQFLAIEALAQAAASLEEADLEGHIASIVDGTRASLRRELDRVQRIKEQALERIQRDIEREQNRLEQERDRLEQRLEQLAERRERNIERSQRYVEREIRRLEREFERKERRASRARLTSKDGYEIISYRYDGETD